ncbi:MAG: polysaccharide export protein [Robiginitomaculum sp.]|nr:MAG: polysaccharide export protein [Robiginitomaculum sp.]
MENAVILSRTRPALAFCSLLAVSACSSGGYHRYPQSAPSQYRSTPATQYNQGGGQNGIATGFRTWRDSDPQYRLLPGDQLDIIVYSAPELSRLLLVGPDGRVQMPLAPPVMAANLTIGQLELRLRTALSKQLINPNVEITPRAFGSQRIYVGGEVGQPGVFELPAQIGVMEAVMMAGGFRNTAKTSKVVLIRRHPDGGPMMRIVNIKSVLSKGAAADLLPLQRGDVVFVPRSGIANINLFMQQYIRDALPVSFSLSYYIGNSNSITPSVSGP